jgi:dUTPase
MKKTKHLQAVQVAMKDTPFTSRNYGGGVAAPTALVQLMHPHANVPVKTFDESIGYDVELVERCDGRTEDMVNDVTLFDTGLVIKPPEGYYFEMVARRSLYKEGYMMANGVEIIDPCYRGNVIVALYKFKDGDDIKLPFGAVQLIPRRAEYIYVGQSDEQLAEEAANFDEPTPVTKPVAQYLSVKGKEKMRPHSSSSRATRGGRAAGTNHMFS